MRFVFLCLLAAAAALGGWLWTERSSEPPRTVPHAAQAAIEGVSVPKALPAEPVMKKPEPEELAAPAAAEPAEAPAAKAELLPLEPEEAEPGDVAAAACLRYGPVAEARLPALRGALERTGLLGQMVMEPVDAALYRVYSGPYASRAKALKALKRLEDGGFAGGTLFELSASSWGIRLGASSSRPKAQAWARTAAQRLELANVVIRDEGRIPNAQMLVFPRLSPEQNQRLRKRLTPSGSARFSVCR